jgi:uncharacterized membrane protein YagU involved in acid resistance
MKNKYQEIFKAGILVGTMDILAAFILVYFRTGKLIIAGILKFIASGLFGKQALSGGRRMILAGLALHYIIAFIFAIFFFQIFPKIKFLSANRIITGILYGIFVWAIMNLIVVPLSGVPSRPFNITGAVINVLILIVAIGIPLSFMASAFYRKQINNSSPH